MSLNDPPDLDCPPAHEETTTLLLVSRHAIATNGLRALFQSQSAYRVLAEAGDGEPAVEAACRLEPRVVIVDLIAQVLNNLSTVSRLRKRLPRTCVVGLSMCTDPAYVSDAFRCGLSAYVLKTEAFDGLLQALAEVAAGRQYVSPMLDADAIRKRISSAARSEDYKCLTPREQQVLQLTAEGLTSAQIAQRLGISRRTAETHRANVHKKLMIETRADLVAFALRRGLVTRDM